MSFDTGVDEPSGRQSKRWDFTSVKPGMSLHVATNTERVRAMAAFRYWAMNHQNERVRNDAYATSLKVGDDDPRGPGYRIWFKSRGTVHVANDQRDAVTQPSEDI